MAAELGAQGRAPIQHGVDAREGAVEVVAGEEVLQQPGVGAGVGDGAVVVLQDAGEGVDVEHQGGMAEPQHHQGREARRRDVLVVVGAVVEGRARGQPGAGVEEMARRRVDIRAGGRLSVARDQGAAVGGGVDAVGGEGLQERQRALAAMGEVARQLAVMVVSGGGCVEALGSVREARGEGGGVVDPVAAEAVGVAREQTPDGAREAVVGGGRRGRRGLGHRRVRIGQQPLADNRRGGLASTPVVS